jgi:lysophospholipase L1-like esterase
LLLAPVLAALLAFGGPPPVDPASPADAAGLVPSPASSSPGSAALEPGSAAPQDPEHRPAPAQGTPPTPLRAVFFGSSTVQGHGASDAGKRWTSLVAARFGWLEVNLGLGGSTLTALAAGPASAEARWDAALAATDPDVLLVMYGANDVVFGGTGVPLGDATTPGTFVHAAHAVLGGIRATFPDAVLVVLTPQPAPAYVARRAAYDEALRDAAAAHAATFVDAGSAFRPGPPYDLDGIHLDDLGHAALAEYVAARLAESAASARLGASAR